jgi:hypothetical protein
MNHQKRNRKNNNNQRSSALPRLPIAISSTLAPISNFLAYVESQNNGDSRDLLESSAPAPLLSEVAKALSSLIINIISNNQEHISPETLSNLIESSLVNILCNPILGSDS